MLTLLQKKQVLLCLALAAIIALLFFIFRSDHFLYQALFLLRQSLQRGEELREVILAYGALAPLVFIGLQVIQVILAPIPGEASGALGGYLFGVVPGFIYSTIGLTIGSWLAFGIGRLLGDLFIARMAEKRFYRRFNRLVSKGDFMIPFLLFLLPGFPKDSLSYLLGLSRMPLVVFLFLSTLGRIPGTLMLSFQGADVQQGNYMRLLILLGISLVVGLPFFLYHRQILAWLSRYQRNRLAETVQGNGAQSPGRGL